MRKLLITILFLSSLLFVSAVDIRFTAEQGENVTIHETCTFGGSPCTSSFDCNITVQNPSQEILLLNQPMTQNETIYSADLNINQTTELGVYEVTQVACTDGSGHNGSSSFFFQITPNGAQTLDSGQGPSLFGIIIILIFATLFFLLLGIFTKNIPFRMFFVALSVLFLVGTLGFGVTIVQQSFGQFDQYVASYGVYFKILTYLLSAAVIGLILYALIKGLELFRMKRGFIE